MRALTTPAFTIPSIQSKGTTDSTTPLEPKQGKAAGSLFGAIKPKDRQPTGRANHGLGGRGPRSLRAANTSDSSGINLPTMSNEVGFMNTGCPPNAEHKRLVPVEKIVGLEALRSLEEVSPLRKKNGFPRIALPGLGVSRHWESRVTNLRTKGPFPTATAQISFTLKSGKTLNAIVAYPTQRELGQTRDFPLVLYSPPGFVGELKFPGMSFFDAQLGLPMMSHFASYGMVSVTVLDPSSVLRDGVENVNHQAQADELNETIDLLLTPDGPLHQHGLPKTQTDRVGTLSYSRGAKVALLAAADRLRNQQKPPNIPNGTKEVGRQQHLKIVSIAKDPVNLGGVPATVVEQIPPCAQELIPETYENWKESSNRYPVAPLPDAPADAHFPINDVSDPVLMFSGEFNWVNSDPRYAAKVFYDALPRENTQNNLLIEVNGPHESWVTDYEIKGDSMALMTAYLLTHLAEREKFQYLLKPAEIMKNGKTFNNVTQGPAQN